MVSIANTVGGYVISIMKLRALLTLFNVNDNLLANVLIYRPSGLTSAMLKFCEGNAHPVNAKAKSHRVNGCLPWANGRF